MHTQHGFTLAELVIILVLTSILAVVAIPRFTGQSEFAASGARDFVRASLRYAQKSAIAMRRNVCVTASGSSLDITYAGSSGSAQACSGSNTLLNPGNNLPYSHATNVFPGGATVAGSSSVVFDAQGRPMSAPGTALSSALSITVSGHATPILIEPETGTVR